MPTSGTGPSNDRGAPPRRAAGFSLIEILVVVVILAVMATAAMLSMGALRTESPLEEEMRRLQALMTLVSEEALVEGRDFGLEVGLEGYRFLAWDPDRRLWLVPEQDTLLKPRELPDGTVPALVVEGREVDLAREARRDRERRDEIVPQVGIFSSGEFTPFELWLREEFESEAWLLRGEVNGTLELLAPERDR